MSRIGDPRSAHEQLRDHAASSLAATVLLTTVMRFAQALGYTRMDLPLMLGTLLTPDRDRAKVQGSLVHMVNGWLFAWAYIALFRAWRRSGPLTGAIVGLAHGLFVLTSVIPVLPGAHRRMASDFTGPQPTTRLEPPGFLALNYGRRTPAVTLAAHVLYGAVLGWSDAAGQRSRR
jgi:hypothetical protein